MSEHARKYSRETIEAAKKRWVEMGADRTILAVAAEFGIPPTTIYKWAETMNWKEAITTAPERMREALEKLERAFVAKVDRDKFDTETLRILELVDRVGQRIADEAKAHAAERERRSEIDPDRLTTFQLDLLTVLFNVASGAAVFMPDAELLAAVSEGADAVRALVEKGR
jgi:hypothetical protein